MPTCFCVGFTLLICYARLAKTSNSRLLGLVHVFIWIFSIGDALTVRLLNFNTFPTLKTSIMKKITLGLALLLANCLSANAQRFSLPATENEIEKLAEMEIEEIIESPLSKSKLYSNAQEWISNTFGDYKKVIQSESPEEGKLILKGHSNLRYKAMDEDMKGFKYEVISYTITIDCKDNKYRYKITNLDLQNIEYNVNAYREISRHIAPSYHLNQISSSKERIEFYRKMIDQKRNTIKNNKKLAKETKYYINQINNKEKEIQDALNFYNEENTILKDLAESLKKAMMINDNF